MVLPVSYLPSLLNLLYVHTHIYTHIHDSHKCIYRSWQNKCDLPLWNLLCFSFLYAPIFQALPCSISGFHKKFYSLDLQLGKNKMTAMESRPLKYNNLLVTSSFLSTWRLWRPTAIIQDILATAPFMLNSTDRSFCYYEVILPC